MSRPTWGDTVRIKEGAPLELRPGALAAVCGMRLAETAELARRFNCQVGATLYLVEFGDGTSVEVPESSIELE